MQARISVRERQPWIEASSADELDRAIEDAIAEAQSANMLNIVFVETPNGNELSIVLGGDETVVQFTYASLDPPYLVSRGKSGQEEPVMTAYVSLNHHTEFPRKWVIPMEDGRAALQEFVRTSLPPTNIE